MPASLPARGRRRARPAEPRPAGACSRRGRRASTRGAWRASPSPPPQPSRPGPRAGRRPGRARRRIRRAGHGEQGVDAPSADLCGLIQAPGQAMDVEGRVSPGRLARETQPGLVVCLGGRLQTVECLIVPPELRVQGGERSEHVRLTGAILCPLEEAEARRHGFGRGRRPVVERRGLAADRRGGGKADRERAGLVVRRCLAHERHLAAVVARRLDRDPRSSLAAGVVLGFEHDERIARRRQHVVRRRHAEADLRQRTLNGAPRREAPVAPRGSIRARLAERDLRLLGVTGDR